MLDEGRFQTPAEESVSTAAAAGLCFVSDDSKGIARKRRGKAFQYLMPSCPFHKTFHWRGLPAQPRQSAGNNNENPR